MDSRRSVVAEMSERRCPYYRGCRGRERAERNAAGGLAQAADSRSEAITNRRPSTRKDGTPTKHPPPHRPPRKPAAPPTKNQTPAELQKAAERGAPTRQATDRVASQAVSASEKHPQKNRRRMSLTGRDYCESRRRRLRDIVHRLSRGVLMTARPAKAAIMLVVGRVRWIITTINYAWHLEYLW